MNNIKVDGRVVNYVRGECVSVLTVSHCACALNKARPSTRFADNTIDRNCLSKSLNTPEFL